MVVLFRERGRDKNGKRKASQIMPRYQRGVCVYVCVCVCVYQARKVRVTCSDLRSLGRGGHISYPRGGIALLRAVLFIFCCVTDDPPPT